jgi:hypothetical protein
MTLSRNYYDGSTNVAGNTYLSDMAEKGDFFFNNVSLIPTSITNSGDDYTVIIDPPLKVGDDVQAGMSFYITPNADNTGAVRLRVTSGGTYYDVTQSDGSDLAAGLWNSLTVYHVVFISGEFRIISYSPNGSAQSGMVNEQIYLSSGVWNKPTGLAANAIVEVMLWGGGGGGPAVNILNAGGGGGGACSIDRYLASAIPDILAVTIGAGGATNTAGGTSTFGSLLSAFGGGGVTTTSACGGGGGGRTSAGAQGAGLAGAGGLGGGGGGGGSNGDLGIGTTTVPALGRYGGGGGTANSTTAGKGGNSVYGGGGGGNNADHGKSTFGGNGAVGTTTAAQVPGGGGAATPNASPANRAGAAGKCIVRVFQ